MKKWVGKKMKNTLLNYLPDRAKWVNTWRKTYIHLFVSVRYCTLVFHVFKDIYLNAIMQIQYIILLKDV